MKSQWKVFARFEPYDPLSSNGYSLAIVREDEWGRSLVKRLELERIEPGQYIKEEERSPVEGSPVEGSPVEGSPVEGSEVEGFLRAMMDAAWNIGLRPTGLEDNKNELTAVRCHLEDMRKLAKVT